MTIEYCNFLANQLAGLKDNKGGEYTPPDMKGSALYYSGSTPVIYWDWGFNRSKYLNYSQPKSKGGMYVTAAVMNEMFSIGITYGIQKVYGWKAHWNELDMQVSAVGYAKGSIIRHSSGKKMISRYDYNRKEQPENYEDTTSWKTIRCTPEFYFDRATYHRLGDVSNGITLPKNPTTANIVVGPLPVYKGETGGFVFLYKSRGLTSRNRYNVANEICSTGNFRMKLSVYDDIYTNRSHKDAYIEVLHQESYAGDIGYQGEFLVRNPHKVVPWSIRKPCYVYLEYENGKTESPTYGWNVWDGGIKENSEELMLAKIVRQLQPPTV